MGFISSGEMRKRAYKNDNKSSDDMSSLLSLNLTALSALTFSSFDLFWGAWLKYKDNTPG